MTSSRLVSKMSVNTVNSNYVVQMSWLKYYLIISKLKLTFSVTKKFLIVKKEFAYANDINNASDTKRTCFVLRQYFETLPAGPS